MNDWIELKDIKNPDDPNESLHDWLAIKKVKFRIFYKPEKEIGCGFNFICVERITFSTNDENWDSEDIIVYSWYGMAYFDGLRHIYANRDNGYINYPDIDMQIEILTELKKLSNKYCRDQ